MEVKVILTEFISWFEIFHTYSMIFFLWHFEMSVNTQSQSRVLEVVYIVAEAKVHVLAQEAGHLGPNITESL